MMHVEPLFVLYALCLDPGYCVRAHTVLRRTVEPVEEKTKDQDPMVKELSRRIKELEAELGEQDKGKFCPRLSEEAVETLLSEEGVPKWMDKPGCVLVQLFKNPEGCRYETNPVLES